MTAPDGAPGGDERDDVLALVHAERELTPQEEKRLQEYAEKSWELLQRDIALRTRATYSVAPQEEFRRCVREHMTLDDWRTMAWADIYHCPNCGLLLKDRKNVAASSVLVERKRMRSLWQEMEAAEPGPAKDEALRRFIAGMGRDE